MEFVSEVTQYSREIFDQDLEEQYCYLLVVIFFKFLLFEVYFFIGIIIFGIIFIY